MYDRILQHIGRHILLEPEEAAFFCALLQEKHLKRRELLLRAGDLCRFEHFIVQGSMRAYSIDDRGQEHVAMLGWEDWWVGDLYAFLTQAPCTLYLEALEPTTVLLISRTDLERLYREVPKFERFFRLLLQNAFVAQQQRISHNLSMSAEQRYVQFVEKYPQAEQRIPQKYIASYLGMTPEFLSMLRRKRAGK